MTILGRLADGRLLVSQSVAGPASYNNAARPTIEFTDLKQSVDQIVGVLSSVGRSVQQQGALAARTCTFQVRAVSTPRVAAGTFTPVAATSEVATGLALVSAALVSFRGTQSLTHYHSFADVGDQAGNPPAGSIDITHLKPTGVADVTPIPATTPWSELDWIAFGPATGEGSVEVPNTTNLSAETYTFIAIGT